ncbi:hypothetical protein P691DRAFT_732875 [Macrolepiota fuliginosa MF-IS2]|uniref:Uncharacterized protein n=1 Tax=Macrolepiota fuliginosa MF-IS2 TaxID=1400762 RepID=A0A9P5XBM2_9AGAR|nr:hypothetical protein P691DRAFT_732875 [Macrolepiota fuliginosa MF-IS2]
MELTQADYESLQLNWTLAAISFTLLIYEYLLTFVDEVERFWPWWLKAFFNFQLQSISRDSENSNNRDGVEAEEADTGGRGCDLSCASVLFFLNRYLTIAGHVPVMWEYFWRITKEDIRERVCTHLQVYHQFLVVVIQFIVAWMMIMRIYALYERRIWVAVLYVTISCLAVGTAIWAIINSKRSKKSPMMVIPYGCGQTLAAEEALYLAAAWIGELVFDTLIFGMTLYKTLTLPRAGGIGLLTMLMRDGTMYFAAMVVTNLANILSFILGGPFSRGSVTMATNAISSALVSRLMLNLRDPKLHLHGTRRGGGGLEWSTINGLGFHGENTRLGG